MSFTNNSHGSLTFSEKFTTQKFVPLKPTKIKSDFFCLLVLRICYFRIKNIATAKFAFSKCKHSDHSSIWINAFHNIIVHLSQCHNIIWSNAIYNLKLSGPYTTAEIGHSFTCNCYRLIVNSSWHSFNLNSSNIGYCKKGRSYSMFPYLSSCLSWNYGNALIKTLHFKALQWALVICTKPLCNVTSFS